MAVIPAVSNAQLPVNNISSTSTKLLTLDGDAVLNGGIEAMAIMMRMLNESAHAKYEEIIKKSEASRELQQYANRLGVKISEMTKADAEETIDKETVKAMYESGILISTPNGKKDILAYLGVTKTGDEGYTEAAGKKLKKDRMAEVQSSVEGVSRRAADIATNSQLIISQITQTYQVTVSTTNSLQGSIHKLNEAIAQGMR